MSYAYLTEEKELLRRTVHEFMRRECPREYVRECDEKKRYPEELVKKTGELGWWGITIPEEYGGYGDYMDMVVLMEAIAYHTIALARDWNRTVNMVGGAVSRFGTREQKEEILPRVAAAEMSLAFALSEADAGSDAAAIKTRAIRSGDQFVFRGSKMWITGALNSHYILTAARTDPEAEKHKGISLILVPRETEGMEIRPMDLLGGHALRTCEIYFTDARVPADRLVGELHNGWLNLLPTLTKERISLAAMCSGAAQAAVDDAVEYAKERVQFGRPIGKFQAISHRLVDMQIKAEAARLLTYQAGYLLNQGVPCDREASSAKVFASDAWMEVAVEGVQVMGGYGYSMEYDMQRHFREAKLFQIFGGTNEIQRIVVARQMGL